MGCSFTDNGATLTSDSFSLDSYSPFDSLVKPIDVIGPPPTLSRISTRAEAKLEHELDLGVNYPSPVHDLREELTPELLDEMIGNTVASMLLGSSL
jgi:hypothetical protein